MRALCSTADGKRGSPPLLSTEILPHCQRQSSKKNTVAGRSSSLTKRAFRVSYEINLLSSRAGALKLIIGPQSRHSLEVIMNRRNERQLHMTDYLANGK
jgi:hypothetical protein